jgi:glycogen debranching enzyme
MTTSSPGRYDPGVAPGPDTIASTRLCGCSGQWGKYLERIQDYAFLDTIVDRRFHCNGTATVQSILEEIIDTYRNGTQFEDRWQEDGDEKCQQIRISMDSDCLVSAGNENTQLTWMDVKPRGCGPVTSRHGKAVEINALWYNALRVMEDIQRRRGYGSRECAGLAEKVKSAFTKFWNEKAGCLYDTIDGNPEQSKKIRPNQVFAVAFGLLDANKSRAIMGKVRQELLTPFGLRTLSPRDPDYRAVHDGECSYHQGTVWPWLIGAFVEGSIIAYGKPRTLRILDGVGYFTALSETLETFGSVPDVCDGGCDSVCKHGKGKGYKSQAWNVGESFPAYPCSYREMIRPTRVKK